MKKRRERIEAHQAESIVASYAALVIALMKRLGKDSVVIAPHEIDRNDGAKLIIDQQSDGVTLKIDGGPKILLSSDLR